MYRLWICALVCGLWLIPAFAHADKTKEPTSHTVYPGQTLGKIAKRYNVTIEALCAENGIRRNSPIKPGQKLAIPGRTPKAPATQTSATPALAKTATATPIAGKREAPKGWRAFAKPSKRPGYITLQATGRSWQGYAVVKGKRLAASAPKGFRHTLYSWRTGKETDISPRLMSTLIQVSDTFGGRPLRIASGYREHSFAKESKHLHGEACDFSVVGVPNEALRDYLLTFSGVGVGFYPNSSFVHLDVRTEKMMWVDTAGPGNAPNYVMRMRLDRDRKAVHRDHRSPRDINNRVANRR
jgi:uncharacterized protein YcbK (DUF882 family)/LysM repeat protein